MKILKGHKRTRLFTAIGGVVVVLVAGLITVSTMTGDSDDRDKFSAAVDNLAGQSIVRYKAALAGAELDIEATADGAAFGKLMFAGQRIELMNIGGKSYLRVPDHLLPTVAPGQSLTDLRGKWITGTDGPLGAAMGEVMSPPGLADRIRAALDRTAEFSHAEEPVDGTPALKVTTPDGDLFITKDAPHHILRFGGTASPPAVPPLPPVPPLPSMPPSAPSLPPIPTNPGPSRMPTLPQMPELPGLHNAQAAPSHPVGGGAAGGAPQLGQGRLDLSYPGKTRVGGVYEKLLAEVGGLEAAIDTGVLFEVDANAQFTDCEALLCTVTVKAKASSPVGRVVGPVTADVRLDMTIDGIPAGECRTTGQLPATGTGTISCVHDDLEWTAIYTLMEAAKKVKPITFIQAKGELQARAAIKPDVDKLTGDIKERLRREVEREHNSQPQVAPAPGRRLTHAASKTELEQCFQGRMQANVPRNFDMEPFTWMGTPAQRATGGIVCATRTTVEKGGRATPAGHPRYGQLNGVPVHRGHLVAARLHGSHLEYNIVTQYQIVNQSDVKIVENAVARVLDRNPGVSVLYRVWVQYPAPTAAMPQWIFIDAVGSNGFTCTAEIENAPNGNASKIRC